jgi:hypothetical protein
LIILIYEISKIFHLPALIFILVFGLSIGNLDELKHYRWTQQFRLDLLNKEVIKFRELIIEATFWLEHYSFFIWVFNQNRRNYKCRLSGYELWNSFLLRFIQLKVSKIPLFLSTFVAPRGLITYYSWV